MSRFNSPEILTAKEVALILNSGESTIYQMAKAGRLPYLRINRLIRFRREQVEEFMERNSVKQK